MTQTIPLNVTASTVLDDSGNGTVSTGPTGSGMSWTGPIVAVHCATNVQEAICRVYAGSGPVPQFFADGTTWGSTGDSSDNMPPTLATGQLLWAVWSGGDAGTTAYLNVTGSQNVA